MDLYLVQNLQLYSNRKLKYSLEWIHSSTRGSTQEDRSLPALLIFSVACSLVKAYGVAYIYSTGPPLLVFLLGLYRYGSSSRLILERVSIPNVRSEKFFHTFRSISSILTVETRATEGNRD